MKIYPLPHELNKPYVFRINEVKKHFPPHRHEFLEFSYIISGSGVEIINGQQHQLEKGVFTLLLPYQIHELLSDPGNTLKLYNCNVGMEAFFSSKRFSEELNTIIFEFNEELPSHVCFKGNEAKRVEGILTEMLNEIKEDKLWGDLVLRAKLIELFALFDRSRQPGKNKHLKVNQYSGQSKKQFLWEIIFYIHNHYREDISLEKLARQFSVGISHLSTSFKNYFGENLHSFLNEIRIKQACGLLVSSNKQIIDIASEVGFNSYTTFSRVFRQKMGISASEYKEKLNSKQI
ncbi:MAG TPA: AraC family transcriptional regulator [Halanaerobiales bacterium]|nr:AraC family transcriptional regulator [Halanaerobiales bacterium]